MKPEVVPILLAVTNTISKEADVIAHPTQITGKVSELKAAQALLANGWQPAFPLVDEAHDIQAWHPELGSARFQVKTIRQRTDRANQYVLYARKGNGTPYTKEDCDFMIGVLGDAVYMTEVRGCSEYWVSESSVEEKWTKLNCEGEIA